MKNRGRRSKAALLAGVLSVSVSLTAMAMPGDVGATWSGYDTYDEWYYNEYGIYPDPQRNDKEVGYATELWWEGCTAHWNFEGACRKFEVGLFFDKSCVARVNALSSQYNFAQYMKLKGEYTFRVKALYGTQISEWSEESDIHRITRDVSEQRWGIVSGGPGYTEKDEWIEAEDGTERKWYRHKDGSYTTNNWEKIEGSWYFFDKEGWMLTGWINWNGETYYCQPDGKMVTGTVTIDGQKRKFSPSGAMRENIVLE